MGGECAGEDDDDEVLVGTEVVENVDDEGDVGGDADGGDKGAMLEAIPPGDDEVFVVFVIFVIGRGKGSGISFSFFLLDEPRHISRIEANSPTCFVRWGTRI